MKRFFAVGLACIFGTLGCKRHDTVLEQLENASRLSAAISTEFAHEFPDTLKPFEKPPELGRIGELTEVQNPKFVLLNFPTADIAKVQSWITPIVARYGIQSISISYFQYAPEADPEKVGFTSGMNRITVFTDGRADTKSGLTIGQAFDRATISGRQIKTKSEQGASPNP